MRSLAVARGTGDPCMDWSFRFIDDPGVSGCVSGVRESSKHVETRDVIVIAAAIQRSATSRASTANCGLDAAKSGAARAKLRGCQRVRPASAMASS